MIKQNDSLTKKLTNKMNEFMINKYWGFVALLCSLLLTVTLFAYTLDQKTIKENIVKVDDKLSSESLDRKVSFDKLKIEIDKKVSQQELKEYKEGIQNLLLYIQASDKEKRELSIKIMELSK